MHSSRATQRFRNRSAGHPHAQTRRRKAYERLIDSVRTMSNVSQPTAFLTATRKLPDDLSIGEYAELVRSLSGIVGVSARANGVDDSRCTVTRTRYGSDFLVVIAIPGVIATTILAVAKAVEKLSAAAKNSAAAEREQAAIELDAAQARKIDAEASKIRAETKLLTLEHEERAMALQRITELYAPGAEALDVLMDDPEVPPQLAEELRRSRRRVNYWRENVVDQLGNSMAVVAAYDINLKVERAGVDGAQETLPPAKRLPHAD